ncbi:TrmO family methyltransferase [Gymnodinialimonas sp. 2305UL16-5]|uniref:TrmO family methyltransferase domain-containing protein n=1 Tax=Gymnodinialimonas mytili TaxID=3126503 RepID=UPI0030A6BF15
MTDAFNLIPIGSCESVDGLFGIRLTPECRDGLIGLSGFSHAIVLWWADQTDSTDQRAQMTVPRPYTATSEDFGVFATRSEARPNPIGLSVFSIASVDHQAGLVTSHYFDLLHGTPILDIKPYVPASDRVIQAQTPTHFDHWPTSLEAAAAFNWDNEFRE